MAVRTAAPRAGPLVGWMAFFGGWVLSSVKRSDAVQGFVVRPRGWVHARVNVVVERPVAWLMKLRRLSKDYEETSTSSAAWIRIAMSHLMVRRLA